MTKTMHIWIDEPGDKQLKPQFFRIDHAGPIYAHYGCCELNCKRQTFHRISGCNRYSTRSASTDRKINLKHYYKDARERQEKKDSTYTFSGVFFIQRPLNTQLAVKFRFYDFNRKGDYYEIVLTDTYAAVHQRVQQKENSTVDDTLNGTVSFTAETFNPVTVNINITKSKYCHLGDSTIKNRGRVSLTRTYETKPYLIFQLKNLERNPVIVKEMSMSKLYSDEIRYDFYYNCSDVLTYFNETTRFPTTIIMNKTVERFNETRYDLVKIFDDSFSLDERYGKYYNDEFHEFEDIEFLYEESQNMNSESKLPSSFIKILTGGCSFLFIGILKYLSSTKFVKSFTGDILDDEKVKKYRDQMSEKFDSQLSGFFGDE